LFLKRKNEKCFERLKKKKKETEMKIQGVAHIENYIKQNVKKKNEKPWFLFLNFFYIIIIL
jgi:hypothetical protein